MLDKQINLFKVDTNAFLSENEKKEKKYLSTLQKRNKELLELKKKNKKNE